MTDLKGENVRVRPMTFDRPQGVYEVVMIDAGKPRDETLCKGTPHERVVERYPHKVEVYVSPTGRSVRVYIDGREIPRQSWGSW